MVLIIVANAGQVRDHLDAVAYAGARPPMPESCRIFGVASAPAVRIYLAPRLDDRAVLKLNAGRAFALECHLVTRLAGADRQIGASLRLAQKRFCGARRRPAFVVV